MVRSVLMLALVAATAGAQTIVDPARLSRVARDFAPGEHEARLRCDVTPLHPALNFGFRFQAGYVVRVPMSQYSGPGHAWVFVTRITPEGGQPVYLAGRARLPSVPPTRAELEAGGVYLLGEGRYRVAWKISDDSGRVCRKEWNIDASLRHSERNVKVALPPGAVTDFSLHGVARAEDLKDDAAPIRLTVLLHAAPISPRRTRVGARDRGLLLGALSSLLERVPVRSVRLVVFNLDQQRELYRQEGFTLQSFGRMAQSFDTLQLDLVDYRVLQKRSGHLDLLADLVNGELKAREPSDVVLFLGPLARFTEKVPSQELETPQGSPPRFYYLQCRQFFGMAPAALPDSISRAVARMKGKTIIINSPGDLAKGIDQIERK